MPLDDFEERSLDKLEWADGSGTRIAQFVSAIRLRHHEAVEKGLKRERRRRTCSGRIRFAPPRSCLSVAAFIGESRAEAHCENRQAGQCQSCATLYRVMTAFHHPKALPSDHITTRGYFAADRILLLNSMCAILRSPETAVGRR